MVTFTSFLAASSTLAYSPQATAANMAPPSARTEVRIVSEHAQKIREAIITEMDRGVTMLSGETGYLKHPTQMIFSVISNRQLPELEKLVRRIDPECFMVVNRVSEVSGRGFSMKKRYC